MLSQEIFHPEVLLIIFSFSIVMAYYLGRERHVGTYWACFFVVFLMPVFGFFIILFSGRIDKKAPKPSRLKAVIGIILSFSGLLLLIGIFFLSINKSGFFSENFLSFFPAIGIFGFGSFLLERSSGKSQNKQYNQEKFIEDISLDDKIFAEKVINFTDPLFSNTILVIIIIYFYGAILGDSLFTLNCLKSAKIMYGTVLFFNNNNRRANEGLGHIYGERGKHEEAIFFFDKAIKRKPKRAKTYYWRAVSKIYAGKDAEALIDIDLAIERGYSNEFVYKKRGQINERLERFEEAIEDYYSVLNYDSTNYYAYSRLAWAKMKTKNFEPSECIKNINNAIRLDSDTTYINNFFIRSLLKDQIGDSLGAKLDRYIFLVNWRQSLENKVNREKWINKEKIYL